MSRDEALPLLALAFPHNRTETLTVLCLGAHSDDIEIGCGGTVLQLLSSYDSLAFVWVVFSSNQEREREACMSAQLFLEPAQHKEIIVKHFRDSYFPYEGAQIKDFFEELKGRVSPDLIFTHYRHDRHQDHRSISDLTWNTWRNHLILEYDIPKYDGDLGSPNCFVPLGPDIYDRKIRYIREAFQTQSDKTWFTEDTLQAILRLRGVECAAPDRYTEAFYCRKLVCNFNGTGR